MTATESETTVGGRGGHSARGGSSILAALVPVAGVVATAAVGTLATDPNSRWYRRIRKPAIQPPRLAFPIMWTSLYAIIAGTTALTRKDLVERGDEAELRTFDLSLATNLVLNAGWSLTFFRWHRISAAVGVAAALALSSAELSARVGRTSRFRGLLLAPYAAWTAYATVLSAEIARVNRG